MSKVIIYQPAKTAMQSGKAKTKRWILKFERVAPGRPDALMGWNTMPDTKQQIDLEFATREEAVAYAEARGLMYEVREPTAAKVAPKAYAENFAFHKRRAFDKKVQN